MEKKLPKIFIGVAQYHLFKQKVQEMKVEKEHVFMM